MDAKRYLERQTEEIERHKWLESEKAGRDLGPEAAIDWILKHAHEFSDFYFGREDVGSIPLRVNMVRSLSEETGG